MLAPLKNAVSNPNPPNAVPARAFIPKLTPRAAPAKALPRKNVVPICPTGPANIMGTIISAFNISGTMPRAVRKACSAVLPPPFNT
jgi:hypothetical protein